ncbi:MAG: glycosyltransferase family 39 protein [Candidatus Omnitrophica bacterium]|nr:glycosyltransferase family 39 protein [Candidatus Omnitrophota bacterium]
MTCTQLISKTSLAVLLTIISVFAVIEITRYFLPWLIASTWKLGSRRNALFAVFFLLYSLWIIVFSMLPPSDRDELIYHLAVPKEIFRSGGFKLFQDNIYAYFPQLGEMFFLWARGIFNETIAEIASKLHHVSFGFLTALALYSYSRSFLPKTYCFLATVVFLTVPSVMQVMPLAYVDMTFTFYSFITLVCLLQFLESPRVSYAILMGALAGAAASTKYTGISFAGLIICVILIYQLARKEKRYARHIPTIILSFGFVFAPYLVRNFFWTGWPLFPFPFFGKQLSSGLNWDLDRAQLYIQFLASFGTRSGGTPLLDDILGPVLVFLKARFNEPRFYEGVLGPIFLMIPIVLWKKTIRPPLKALLCFTGLFFFYWTFTTKQVRFLFPILPVLCFLLVFGIAESKRKNILSFLVVPLLLFNLHAGVKESLQKQPLPYLAGSESRSAYLIRQWPGLVMYFDANKRIGVEETVYLVNMKNYVYYLDCSWRADFIFERWWLEKALELNANTSEFHAALRSREITHILLDTEFIRSDLWGLEGKGRERFQKLLTARSFEVSQSGPFSLRKLV